MAKKRESGKKGVNKFLVAGVLIVALGAFLIYSFSGDKISLSPSQEELAKTEFALVESGDKVYLISTEAGTTLDVGSVYWFDSLTELRAELNKKAPLSGKISKEVKIARAP